MDLSQLDNFINTKDKGSASQEKKTVYIKQLILLLKEEGYCDQTEKYIFGGTPIESMMAFFKYLSECPIDDAKLIFQKYNSGILHTQNALGFAFKRDLTLLALFINANLAKDEFGKALIIQIGNSVRNKENKRWGDYAKVVEKNFVKMIAPKAPFPDLVLMGLQAKYIQHFSEIILDALALMKVTKPSDILVADQITKWLTLRIDPAEGSEVSKAEDNNDQNNNKDNKDDKDNSEIKDAAFTDSPKTQNVPVEEKKTDKIMPLTKREQLLSIANYLDNLERQVSNLIKARDGLQQKNSLLESTKITMENKLRKSEDDLKEMANRKESLDQEVLFLKSQIARQEGTIEDLNSDIQKRDAVLSIFSSDKENSQKEQLNAIASKLRTEYMDFKDAGDIEMTLDLGENMRQQLALVFKILAKNGIDIERR